ncbi:MAG TPA: class I SAM-dependent methyltransferase [Chitinophagaceae bacterium]
MRVGNSLIQKHRKNPSITLGPVKELESHVHPEWWRYIFNSLYIKTDADVVDDDEITRYEIDVFLKILNICTEASVLDLCCGQGRHSFELYKRGYNNIEGLDRSSYLISKARNKSREFGIPVKFREGDARKLSYRPNSFDVVLILGNSFGYFESSDDDLQVLQSVARVLKPDGILLIDVADGDFLKQNFKPRSWEWINKKYFVCRERCLSASGKKLISREVITHTDKGVIADQFYAENLYSVNSLQLLAEEAGFENITTHPTLSVNSQRNQDLGMMENRIILTARIKK